jgi:hypothetical protein
MNWLSPKFGLAALSTISVVLASVPSFTKPMMQRFMRTPTRQTDATVQRLEQRCDESRLNLFHLPFLTGKNPDEITAECRQYQAALGRPQGNQATAMAPQASSLRSPTTAYNSRPYDARSANSPSYRSQRPRPLRDRSGLNSSQAMQDSRDRPPLYQPQTTPQSQSLTPAQSTTQSSRRQSFQSSRRDRPNRRRFRTSTNQQPQYTPKYSPRPRSSDQ